MKIVLQVDDMHCGGCEKSIKNAIKNADGAARVATDLVSRRVEAETSLAPAAIAALLDAAGYPAQIVETAGS